MVEIIGIKFKNGGKVYYFNPRGIEFVQGEKAIVETARGVEIGLVTVENKLIHEDELVSPLKDVIRKATKEDEKTELENAQKEKEALAICQDLINKHELDMHLIDSQYTFDRNKLLFYFTADGRVDFRELVKDLASVFKTRIELRQIGIRDEAKMLGGIGICGRSLCCNSFLDGFHPVSIKMAKEQGLSLNPTKISGNCGRLMCCLKYEQNCYDEYYKIAPSVGAIVSTPQGKGVVQSVTVLKGIAKVKLDNELEAQLTEFNFSDLKILKNNKAQDNSETDMKELKKLEDN